MARTKLSYKTVNSLKSMLVIKKAEMTSEKGGIKVLLKDVEEDLAEFCGLTRDGIVAIKRGRNQPSLAVAMRICQYFNCKVEDIFRLEVEEGEVRN